MQRLNVELTSEAQRRGALGLIGQNTGALMLDRTGNAVTREHILNADGSVTENEMVSSREVAFLYIFHT